MVFDDKYEEVQNHCIRLPYTVNNVSYIARNADPGATVVISGDEVHITTKFAKEVMSALRGSMSSQIQAKYIDGILIVSQSHRIEID